MTLDLTTSKGLNILPHVLKRRGSCNAVKPLPGCVKDVSPSLTILTTSVTLEPFQGTTYTGGNFNAEFNKDGTIYGTSGSASDSATWEIVNDTLCIKWDNWHYGERYCVYYELQDNGDFKAFYPDGQNKSTFIGQVDLPKPTTASVPKPPPSATSPAVKFPQRQSDGTIEERLSKLKELLDKGLLTPDEAAAKRKEILKGL